MFRLTSPAFDDGQEMAQKFGKKAQNVSPPLAWEDAPDGTKGFAIALVDRHPVADNYVHWLLDGIDPHRRSLEEGAAGGPGGLAGARELKPYVGPFPPSGTHDYEFTIYALDTQRWTCEEMPAWRSSLGPRRRTAWPPRPWSESSPSWGRPR